jgi:hypothetical protein
VSSLLDSALTPHHGHASTNRWTHHTTVREGLITMLHLAAKPRTTASRNALHTAIRDRQPFTTSGALSARTIPAATFINTGRLSHDNRVQWNQELPTYAVFSYGTPIAWWSTKHGWTIPDARYSVTTTAHQGQVRTATADAR